MRGQRGFTLIEILIALILMAFVGITIIRVLSNQQRLAVSQVEQASVQQNVRGGLTVVANEIRELATSPTGATDIVSLSSNAITYRAMRSLGITCLIAPTEVRILRNPLYGARPITPGQDGLLLYVERDSSLNTDDSWLQLPITDVHPTAACGGVPAVSINTTITMPLDSLQLGAPVRTFEVMEVGQVNVGGLEWLGARSVSGGQPALVPVAGPVTASGVAFAAFDSLGNTTATLARIRSITITLRGRSDRAVRTGGNIGILQPIQDSLIMQVQLRNTPYP
jgi:prepilin-type N-terminal cleavage/methylation domain-containing protein